MLSLSLLTNIFDFSVWILNVSFFSFLFIQSNLLTDQISIVEATTSVSQAKQRSLPKSSSTSTKMNMTSKQRTPPKSTLKQTLAPSLIDVELTTTSAESIDLSQIPPDNEIFEEDEEVVVFF
jgi:hypothetical protein